MAAGCIQGDLKTLVCALTIVGKRVTTGQEITMRKECGRGVLVEMMCDHLSGPGGSDKWDM